MKRAHRLPFLLLSLVAGCRGAADDGVRRAAAPLVVAATDDSDADTTDVADRECRVVLRRADRDVGSGAAAVAALVDVDARLLADPGATAGVLFRADGGDWQALDAQPTDGAPAGFARFVARFAVEQSADFIAYARTTTQVRLFDHNRLPGDFDSFHVDGGDGFAVPEAPLVCPGLRPITRLDFAADFTVAADGAIVAGDRLEVDYALARLTACRDTHDGFRFWSLDAYAQFQPGGQLVTGTVVASNGAASSAVPFVTDVPAGATSVALWFRNYSPPSCEGWDSSYGANYAFAVVAPQP